MIRTGLLVAAAVAAVVPSTASAAWGPVLRPPSSAGQSPSALAVNASGDVASAWVQELRGTTLVRAFVRRGDEPLAVRTLLRARRLGVAGLTAALDRRGELTLAWVDQDQRSATRAGPITIRAVYRTPARRWSPVQAVSRTSAFGYAQPRLAAASDGTVVLSFNAGVRAAPGVGAAWRVPGRPFGRVRPVAGTGRGYLQEPTLAFDMRDRVHLAGIAGCDDASRSVGRLFTATRESRRFTSGRIVAPAPATHLRFALTGLGTAAFGWIGTGCSTSEDLSGPVRARTLRDGLLSGPLLLDGGLSRALTVAVATGHGAAATWTGYPQGVPDGRVLTSRMESFGTASPAAPPQDGWAVIAGTRRGTRLVARLRPDGLGPPDAVAARAGRGGPPEPAPLGALTSLTTATSPTGAALAVADRSATGLRVSVWRP